MGREEVGEKVYTGGGEGGGGVVSPALSFFIFNQKGARGKLNSNALFRHKKGLEGV